MLKKKYRLSVLKRKRNEKTISSPLFTIKYLASGEDISKFAFIITKRIDKRAVVRNKIKRSLSKGLEEILEKIIPGRNFIFIPKKEILEKSKEEVAENVKEVFKTNNLLK